MMICLPKEITLICEADVVQSSPQKREFRFVLTCIQCHFWKSMVGLVGFMQDKMFNAVAWILYVKRQQKLGFKANKSM